ncbi:MAG: CNNM domain-containing protein, partial [bacterium]|nr:CNNM domain-containing protein [bacterium]
MTALYVAVAAILLVANAGFVAVEFALIAARRSRLEPLADAGNRRARMALAAMSDINRQLAGAQLGITMASLGLGFVA